MNNIFGTICSYLSCMKKEEEKKMKSEIIENRNYITYKLGKTNNEYECVICLENMINGDEIILTECFHMYHKNCIGDWLKISNICPICDFKL